MKLLNDILNNVPEFGQLLAAMDSGRCPVALSGLSAVHRAHFAAGVYARTGRPVVLVCADEGEGERLARDLESLTGQRVPVLAPRSYIFHNAATVSRQWEHRRLALMRAMAAGEVPLLVAAVEGLLQRTLPPEELDRAWAELRTGGSYDLNQLAETLTAAGYSPVRPGGRRGTVCPAGRDLGCLLPGDGAARAGGVLRRRAGCHGAVRPRHPAPDGERGAGGAAAGGGGAAPSGARRDGGAGSPAGEAGRRGGEGGAAWAGPDSAAGPGGAGAGAELPRHGPLSGADLSPAGHGGRLPAAGRLCALF